MRIIIIYYKLIYFNSDMSCLIKTVPQERPTHRAGMGGTSTILNHLATVNPSATLQTPIGFCKTPVKLRTA
jgi:hypothetical protein